MKVLLFLDLYQVERQDSSVGRALVYRFDGPGSNPAGGKTFFWQIGNTPYGDNPA